MAAIDREPKKPTTERIIRSAERMFAKNGIAATSLRSIIADAKVNLAAVHYHFGSKDSLVRHVFSRRIEWINRERLSALEELKKKSARNPLEVNALLRAFIRPAFKLRRDRINGGADFIRMMGRAQTEALPELRRYVFEELAQVIAEYLKELKRALPHLSERAIARRFMFSIGSMVMTLLGSAEETPFGQMLDLDDETSILDELVGFAGAGFRSGET